MTLGAQAIAQVSFKIYVLRIQKDEFSKCFVQKPRPNFFKSLSIGPGHVVGIFIRYGLLFPYRLCLLLLYTLFFFALLPIILYTESDAWQRWLFRMYCGAFLASWGSRNHYYGRKPRLNVPHVCVSNHTSFIDYLILSAHEFPHSVVAQVHL